MVSDDTDATVFDRLRERSLAHAYLWAAAETGRIVSASVMFCGPWVILVFLVFDAAQQSISELMKLLTEWQVYVFLIVVAGVSFAGWRLCERITRRILRVLEDGQV